MEKNSGVRRANYQSRIANTVVKLVLKEDPSSKLPPHCSALDAVTITRERCKSCNWVIEFDIQAMFDTIPCDPLMKSVRHHTDCRLVILYSERLTKASMQDATGEIIERTQGTTQGSPLSPLLSNLYMHYAFNL